MCVVHCGIFLFHVIHTTVHHKQIGASNSYSNRLEAELALLGSFNVLGGPLLGLSALLLPVINLVKTLGLELTVDEGTGETSEDLLGLGVVGGLA